MATTPTQSPGNGTTPDGATTDGFYIQRPPRLRYDHTQPLQSESRSGRFISFLMSHINEWCVYGDFDNGGHIIDVRQAAERRGMQVEVCSRSVHADPLCPIRIYARAVR